MTYSHSLDGQRRSPLLDRTLAAIDVGTNSIHMAVVQIDPNLPSFRIIDREKATVRLGDRCPDTGNLKAEAMERSLAALRRCKEIAESRKVEAIVAVATSAMREAPNGREFLQRIQQEVGLDVDLISGQEEARRIYLGVISGMELQNLPHVIIDIGGGSTELILGDGHEPRSLSSTKVGAVRLTAQYVTTDPISEAELSSLQAYIRGMMERSVDELKAQLRPGETPILVGTSGTIEALATIHALQTSPTEPGTLNGYRFTRENLETMIHQFQALRCEERLQLPGMAERRAEIILAGALILYETMGLLGAEHIQVCERALREGIIVDWMLAHGLIEDRLRYQESVRQRSVMNVAAKYQVSMNHAKRVAAFALSLFDQLAGRLHDWGDEERDLLWAAAILHNCGHHISHGSHHKHSYYLIRNSQLLGYTENQIEAIANLARYHRKSPPKKKHNNFQSLTSKRYKLMVAQLSALLRLAVALDRRQLGVVKTVQCHYDNESKVLDLHVEPATADDCNIEIWNLDFKKDIFEDEFNVTVHTQLAGVA